MSFLKRPKPFEDVPRFGNLSKEEMQRVVDAGRAFVAFVNLNAENAYKVMIRAKREA